MRGYNATITWESPMEVLVRRHIARCFGIQTITTKRGNDMSKAREAAEKLVQSRTGRKSYDKVQILGATEDGYRVGYERGLRDGDIVAEQEGRREDNDAWEKEVERLGNVIEKLKEALRDVRTAIAPLANGNRAWNVDYLDRTFSKALGEPEEKPKQRTLKDIREACPKNWTLDQMGCIKEEQFGLGLGSFPYADYEAGRKGFTLDSKICDWLASRLDDSASNIYAGSCAAIAERKAAE